ncbi:DUF2971 domain-containing protein [Aeromonas caviae]|uniref:DUF2971 domain-containing protein n=1 Tax=Aeromonas caviae TaxID=648 RepID=UPI002B479DB7|nr:DUF2971 domain-containing protein [Aeromonas caviae]
MNTAFKYMSYLGVEYFENPTFRISLVEELNDPFEGSLSDDIDRIVDEMMKSMISEDDIDADKEEELKKVVERNIKGTLNGAGVISFSETHRNLLMWAHYADNHEGICIEVETDWSKSKPRLYDTLSNALHSFQRVKYDTRRADYSDIVEINVQNQNKITIDLCMKHLTLKSDEWMYEKEHRNIMSFLEADYVKLKPGKTIPKELRNRINKSKIKYLDNGYTTTECSDLEFFDNVFESNLFMYLSKVPANKIKRIYLGARFNEKDKIINAFKNPNHPLHHVEIFKCEINNSRFEIDAIRVY